MSSDGIPDGTNTKKSRTTVRRRALLSSVGVAGTTFIAGCGGDSGSSSTDTDDDTNGGGNQGSTDGDGGSSDGGSSDEQYFITDVNDDPTSLDPHAIGPTLNAANMVFPMNAYEPLVFYEPNGSELMPVLATEVPTVDNGLISEDARTFEFPLREGVQFHTGGEMTAEDVRFSIERMRTMGVAPDANNLEIIENIEVPDDYTIRFTTSEPSPAFLNSTVPSKSMVVVSQDAVENNGGVQENQQNRWMAQNTAGTGPYQLGAWNRGSRLEWDPFEEYWAPDTVGPDGVLQRVYSEVSSAVSTMQRGDAHATGYEQSNLTSFSEAGADYTYFLSFAQLYMWFNFEIPYDRDDMPDDDTVPSDFFQDPNVRRAFGFAVDFEEYRENVWDGRGQKSNQPVHVPPLRYYDEDAPNFSRDPDRVEELLREAGYWEEGFTLTLMAQNFAEAENTVLYLKDKIESLNDRITINTQTLTEAQFSDRRSETPHSFPFLVHGFPGFGPDPVPYYNAAFDGVLTEGGNQREHLNERMFEAVNEAATTADEDRRQELYSELQQLAFEDPPLISLITEELVQIHQECAEPPVNSASTMTVNKRWDISGCDPIDF